MTNVRKFLFDTDFDLPDEPQEAAAADEPEEIEPEAPTFSEEDLERAREEGFKAGREQGVREASDAVERRAADLLGAIAAAFDDLFQRQQDMHNEALRDAVSIAVVITRKLFPVYSRRGALGEVEQMVRTAVEKALGEPRIVIHVHPELEPSLGEPVTALATGKGYDGKVLLLPDDGLEISDARVEWTDGGTARDTAAMWRDIEEIVAQTLGENEDENSDDAVAGNGKEQEQADGGTPAVEGSAPSVAGAEAAADQRSSLGGNHG